MRPGARRGWVVEAGCDRPDPGERDVRRVESWRGRSRFVRRLGLVFALILVLSVVGLVTLVSALLGRIGAADAGAWTAVAVAAALIAVVVVPLIFVATMRRVGVPSSRLAPS